MNIETKCVQAGWQPHKRRAEEIADLSEHYLEYDTSEEMVNSLWPWGRGIFYTQDFKPYQWQRSR